MSGDDEFPALDLGEPAPRPRPKPRPRPTAPPTPIPAEGMVLGVKRENGREFCVKTDPDRPVSFACYCGFRDEVQQPAPDRLDCPECKRPESLRAYAPRYGPPRGAGRRLTPQEVEGIALDARRSRAIGHP